MNKLASLYLYILPFYSLLGILLGAYRVTDQLHLNDIFILIGAVFGMTITLSGWKYLKNKTITFLIILLIFSIVIGLLNGNEISRRYITDLTNPFIFFSLIIIFSKYWKNHDWTKYIKYYIIVTFWGSLLLLPVVYFLFIRAGVGRLAIFPPMELPFAYYIQNGSGLLLLSFIIILLYGKRAQFGGAIATFLIFILAFRRNKVVKYGIILIIGLVGTIILFNAFPDNLAIKRLTNSFEAFNNSGNDFNQVSAGRSDEIKALLDDMQFVDFFLGKGVGYTYFQIINGEKKETANSHFSPLAFDSKYGIIFTVFIYWFVLSLLLKYRPKSVDESYKIAWSMVLFIFLESFFSYALFVTPILPIGLGYIYHRQNNNTGRFINKHITISNESVIY